MNMPLSAAAVVVTRRADCARFSLRLRPEAAAAVTPALGFALPSRVGDRTADGERAALCLGPDEWMLTAPEAEAPALKAAFAAVYAAAPHALADVSDREVAYALEGQGVLDLLATCCPLDLARMEVGRGTRTVFDTVQVVLVREASDRFRLEVWRSFAPHVEALLARGAEELRIGL
jgi:sarcosine oxidase subunit gamma